MVVDEIDTDSSVADYSIELESQIIYLKIQDAFQPKSSRPDNLAEREYVSVIIDSFSNYLIEYGFKPEAKKLLNEKKK